MIDLEDEHGQAKQVDNVFIQISDYLVSIYHYWAVIALLDQQLFLRKNNYISLNSFLK